MLSARCIVLVDPDERQRNVLAGRLRAQEFVVDTFGDPSEAANHALSNPPHALIANVWMPGVSGVQLCRLLKAEPATSEVPIILRAEGDAPKARFWAEQAGAFAYVPTGRIGELVRALERAIRDAPEADGFFMHMAQTDIRDRIAQHLDEALFESVIASSVRALGTCESSNRLFDLFSQFVCRITTYRWLALMTEHPPRLSVHCHPGTAEESVRAARAALSADHAELLLVEDEDASGAGTSQPVVASQITFGDKRLGALAVQPLEIDSSTEALMQLIAREIGGPLRIATLVEESRRLAQHDPLTGIMNRRAFVERMSHELDRPADSRNVLCLLLLDVDHFKSINDTYGHHGGDRVLCEMGRVLTNSVPSGGHLARWGGEEFVMAYHASSELDASTFADDLRETIAQTSVRLDAGSEVEVTVSIGVAEHLRAETLEGLVERADHAMYAAKVAGRNRVELAPRVMRPAPSTFSLRVPA